MAGQLRTANGAFIGWVCSCPPEVGAAGFPRGAAAVSCYRSAGVRPCRAAHHILFPRLVRRCRCAALAPDCTAGHPEDIPSKARLTTTHLAAHRKPSIAHMATWNSLGISHWLEYMHGSMHWLTSDKSHGHLGSVFIVLKGDRLFVLPPWQCGPKHQYTTR